jgi:hypothetical protein
MPRRSEQHTAHQVFKKLAAKAARANDQDAAASHEKVP